MSRQPFPSRAMGVFARPEPHAGVAVTVPLQRSSGIAVARSVRLASHSTVCALERSPGTCAQAFWKSVRMAVRPRHIASPKKYTASEVSTGPIASTSWVFVAAVQDSSAEEASSVCAAKRTVSCAVDSSRALIDQIGGTSPAPSSLLSTVKPCRS